MSDWLFDLGNSRFKFAPLQGDRAGDVQAWAHGAEGMAGQPPHSLPSGSTAFVASVAAPSLTSAMLDQLQRRFEHACSQLDERDQEIVVMRHFEHLSNSEAADSLQLTPQATSMRYLRAMRRLRALLEDEEESPES